MEKKAEDEKGQWKEELWYRRSRSSSGTSSGGTTTTTAILIVSPRTQSVFPRNVPKPLLVSSSLLLYSDPTSKAFPRLKGEGPLLDFALLINPAAPA